MHQILPYLHIPRWSPGNCMGCQVAEWLGNRASIQKVAGLIPGCAKLRCVLGQGTSPFLPRENVPVLTVSLLTVTLMCHVSDSQVEDISGPHLHRIPVMLVGVHSGDSVAMVTVPWCEAGRPDRARSLPLRPSPPWSGSASASSRTALLWRPSPALSVCSSDESAPVSVQGTHSYSLPSLPKKLSN